MMKKYIFLLLICSSPIHAQSLNTAKLDSLFTLLENNFKGMGSFSIFSNGKEVYHNSFGFADVSTKTQANSTTKYRIGSITKTFTATIIMQLIEEGKISLSTVLSNYFPKIPNADKITVEDLLRHQSGLYNITDDKDLKTWMTKPQSRDQMIARIIEKGVIFEPKAKNLYSNTNYILLSYIAEIIDRRKFREIIADRIVNPLNLNRTEFGTKINSTNNEALAYKSTGSNWKLIEKQTDTSLPMGAGGVVSTPTELNIFMNNLFSANLISANSLAKMKEVKDGIGLGLMKLPFGDKEVYGHGGSIDGFQSMLAYFPKENVSLALTTNSLYTQVSNIFIGAVQIYFGIPYKLPDFSPIQTIQVSADKLNTYIGEYSSPDFPLSIVVRRDGSKLLVQAEGQPPFSVVAIAKDTFYSEKIMIKLIFMPEDGKMQLSQSGKVSEFIRK